MNHSTHGKIIHHDAGLGLPDLDMVRQRALELARIAGRQDFTPEDWRCAKLELHGHLDEEDERVEATADPTEIAGSAGHRVEQRPPAEAPENINAELISEGLEEAAHDQMLQANKPEGESA